MSPVFRRPDSTLARDLRRQAAAWLAAAGEHRHADARLVAKAAMLAAASITCYAASLRAGHVGGFAAAYVAAIFAAMLLAINSLHDAAHGAFFRSPRANRALMRAVALPLGIEPAYWLTRHVHYHHAHANIDGLDLDIAANPVLRQTPFQPWRPHQRAQHLYWPLVAAISLPWITWVLDWADLCGRTPLRRDAVLPGAGGWFVFLAAKAAHATLAFALPLLLTPWSGPAVLGAYLLAQLLASCCLVAAILGTHWADVAFYREKDASLLPHGWHEHAFLTAIDWRCPGWLRPLLGGLERHRTHHLFPGWSHRHYEALAPLVEAAGRAHGLPCRTLGWRALWQAQQRFLRAMGHGATRWPDEAPR